MSCALNKGAASAQLKLKFGQVRGSGLQLCNLRHLPEIKNGFRRCGATAARKR
jgi:hypothetical protein